MKSLQETAEEAHVKTKDKYLSFRAYAVNTPDKHWFTMHMFGRKIYLYSEGALFKVSAKDLKENIEKGLIWHVAAYNSEGAMYIKLN